MAASKKDVAKQQVKEDREKVREMYLSGKTVKEIAKETYFSSSYCYAMVRDLAKEKNFAKKAKRAPLDEAMIQDAKAGMTVAEIAKKHGVTYQQCYYTVSEYAQATIKKNKKKQSAATKVRNAAMLEDAKAGMTDKEIAKKYFLSRSSVRTVLAGHLHTNSKKLDERRKAILADYEAGTSSKDICEKYGISKSTLYKDMDNGKTDSEEMRFIEFPAFTTIYVSPDSTVDLVNPESNHVYFKYTILENDEVLYESDYIAPGQKYAWQASDYITGAGEHAVVFSVSTVGVDDQQPRNGAEFAVTAVVS